MAKFKESIKYKICPGCGKEFKEVTTYYPSKVDDRRNTWYKCPYCGYEFDIIAEGDEEIDAKPID